MNLRLRLASQGGNEWTRIIDVGVIAASVAIPPNEQACCYIDSH